MSFASPPLSRSRLDPMLRPIATFLAAESAGGVLLMASTLFALIWANSPWNQSYFHLWNTNLTFGIGSLSHSTSLAHCVNDGLMAVFFLLVGLEIKRELLLGELASIRRAALPVVSAIGGMLVPALLYKGLNLHGAGKPGWGIPMATDIAFAVGVLALVGRSLPISAKVFLLAVAIVDDLGAVVVIAAFYTDNISIISLSMAGGCFGILVILNVLRVHSPLAYILAGIGLWGTMLGSGIHATIAGVLLAFTIPATRQLEEVTYLDYSRRMLADFERDTAVIPDKITENQSHALKAMEEAAKAVQTPLARIEHALLKPVNFIIMPIFAFANAGVDIRSTRITSQGGPILCGIILGLLIGKPLGISLASWLAVKSGIAALPSETSWWQIFAISVLCGIGFTMSVFVANLAFSGNDTLLSASKIGVLIASLLSGLAGGLLIVLSKRR